MNEYLPTIPHIAELLALHIRRDNDAKRLITEHILPLMGIHFDTAEEAARMPEDLEAAERDITDAYKDLAAIRTKLVEIRHELSMDSETYAEDLESVHTGWHETVDGIVNDLDSCVTANLYGR